MTATPLSTFATILFPPALLTPGREVEVRVMRPERPLAPGEDGTPRWSRPQLERREWFTSADALARWKPPQDRHVWAGGAVREGRVGTKEGVVAAACLWADLDAGGDEALARVRQDLARIDLLPTLTVQTSPGKHHLWWRLAAPVDLADLEARRCFEGLVAALAARVGGDRACVDCSRVLRLPGSVNVKPWYEAPHAVGVVEADPARAYALARFEALAPPVAPRVIVARNVTQRPQGATVTNDTVPGLPAIPALPHLARCAFVRHCHQHAANLPEPLWTALAWTLAPHGDAGDDALHALSRPHPTYERGDTDAKLAWARGHGYRPPSCRALAERGFACPNMDAQSGACTLATVRSPSSLIQQGPMHPGTAFVRGGRTWRFEGERPPVPLADFTVRFTEEVALPEGGKRLTVEASTPTGTVHRLEVPGEALADPKDLARRLAGAMGSDFRGLDTRNVATARDAWLATSEVRRVRVSRDFGFAADGRSFVGLDLASDGEVRLEVPTAAAASLGLRSVPAEQVDATLRLLVERWPRVACGESTARLVLGAAVWALVAPVLEARDASVSPLCVWVTGASGLGKSTTATTVQCLFGDFAERGRLVSFGSTPYSIEDGAHDFRGALMVLDDAKESAIGPGQRATLLGVLQRLHDRTARARLRSDGAQQRARGSRTTVLVNGEDVLFSEASVRARYFAIPARGAVDLGETGLRVHEALRQGAPGVMAALARQLLDHPAWFDRVLRAYHDERARLEGVLPRGDNRPRVAASAAAILAGWRFFLGFAQGRGVLDAATAQAQTDTLRAEATVLASEQVLRTASLTPGERFLADLRQLLAADLVRIDGLSVGHARGTRVGFVGDGWIGVFPEVAVVRCNEELHRDGDRLPPAESVGASLAVIGALAAQGKDRVASRKGDPSEPGRKPSVWLLKPNQLIEGDEHADL
ncbi:MAG: hypothetical protein RLZZ299_1445 [Pseudomonadota bacterium]|jgi:hypothetical protein